MYDEDFLRTGVVTDEEKENSFLAIVPQSQNSETLMVGEGKLDLVHSSTINVENQDEKQRQTEIGIGSVEMESIQVSNMLQNFCAPELLMDEDRLEILELLSNHSSIGGDYVAGGKGEKRLFGSDLNLMSNENFLNPSDHIYYSDFIAVKKQCVQLEARVQKLEEQTSRKYDSERIRDSSDMKSKSRNVQENHVIDKDDDITEIIEILNINAKCLAQHKKKTATATARSLIRVKYPNPKANFDFSDVDEMIVESIIKYSRYSHPHDTSTDKELRRSMKNYFSCIKYQRKKKEMSISKESDEESN